jgi:glycosyltransferase involved in cell wall biosynthesis
LDQTYKNWEWVIIDDSDDNDVTFNLLKEISEIDHRIKVFKNARRSGSIGELKRWAAGLCSGEYLCELDHDDELTSKCLEYVVKTFQKYPEAGFAYTDSAEIYEDDKSNVKYEAGFSLGYGSYRQEIYNGKTYEVVNGPKINPKTIRHIVGIPNHIRSWRRDTYFKVNGHNPHLHVCDDYELIIKTFLTTKIAYIPKLGYIQYRNKDGNTTISRNKEIQRLTRIIKNSYDHLIHKKFVELEINDFLYNEKTQSSNIDVPNPPFEQHVCIISDVN